MFLSLAPETSIFGVHREERERERREREEREKREKESERERERERKREREHLLYKDRVGFEELVDSLGRR